MTLTALIIQLLLTIPLTLILNYLSKREDNMLNKIVFPTIYTIIVAALIPSVKDNIFLIVVFEIFLRNFYISNFSHKSNNIVKFLIETILSVVLSLFVYNNFIAQVSNVLPNPENIKPFLWFLIVIYVYNLCKPQLSKVNNIIPNKNEIDKENTIMQYAKYKNKFHKVIKTKNKLIINLVYSIMIYNGTTRPSIYRKAMELKGMLTTQEVPYGIMQFKSKEKLSDNESIVKTIKEFELLLQNSKANENNKIDTMLKNYPEEEKVQIKEIYNEIIEFLKK